MFKFSWITKNIAVGSVFKTEDAPKIKKMGVDAIIEIRSEGRDDEKRLKELGIEYLHVDVVDRYAPTQKQLNTIYGFALPLLRQNKKIFIHCQNGYGRSPLVVISILVEKGMSVGDALQLAKDKHSELAFTPQQEKFMYDLMKTTDGEW
ncbi:dual specificity protein phosphatase family protein [Candidatus Omnitrophota bacterium]